MDSLDSSQIDGRNKWIEKMEGKIYPTITTLNRVISDSHMLLSKMLKMCRRPNGIIDFFEKEYVSQAYHLSSSSIKYKRLCFLFSLFYELHQMPLQISINSLCKKRKMYYGNGNHNSWYVMTSRILIAFPLHTMKPPNKDGE